MMRVVLIILLLISASAALAQDATPAAPWPPDPTTIFAEGMQWSLYEEPVEAPTPTTTPVSVAEAETVRIEYGLNAVEQTDPTSGLIHLYPFPIRGPVIESAVLQKDGRILVRTRYARTDSQLAFFLLDPQTGLYQHIYVPTVCERRVIQAAPGTGTWIIVDRRNHYRSEDMFLCQTETGQMRQPEGINLEDMGLISTPNPNRILMLDYNTTDYPMFSYDAEKDVVVSLGTVSEQLDNEVSICDWFTENKGILCTEDGNGRDYISRGYYEFDMTQENSIKLLFYGWPETIFSLSNPKRYFTVYDTLYGWGQSGTDPESNICRLSIYDGTKLQDHVFGETCLPILRSEYWSSLFSWYGDHLYYLTTDGKRSVSTLHYYDLETDQISEDLLTDEIENIISVSPDERYVVLLLDNDGWLNFQWQPEYCCFGVMNMGILDTHTSQIVYRSEPMGLYHGSQVRWLDDTTVVASSMERYDSVDTGQNETPQEIKIPASTRVIHIEDGEAVARIVTDHSCMFKDRKGEAFSLFETVSDAGMACFTGDYVLNLETFEAVRVIKSSKPEEYWTSFERWDSDGALILSVALYYEHDIHYRVVLP